MLIRFDRQLTIQSILIALALLWPALLFGHPAYFPDTTSYYRGGEAAVAFAESRLPWPGRAARPIAGQPVAKSPDGAAPAQVVEEARGARSIPYSIVTYLLAGPQRILAPLVMLHAAMAALCIATLLAIAGLRGRALALGIALIAGATPAAWFTGFAMPDILAAIVILGMALLFCVPERISRPLQAVLVAITVFAITAHTSHLGIALALLLVMALASAWAAVRRRLLPWRGLALNMAVVGAAVLTTVASGYVGFGEVSLAAKRYPFALGRALDDPAMRLDLEAACRRHAYMVCTLYSDGLPDSGFEFLWGPRGVARIATPAQMAALRQEEPPLLMIMASASPAETERHILGGFFQQLVTLGFEDADYERRMVPDPHTGILLLPEVAGPFHWLRGLIEQLSMASAGVAAIALALWTRPKNPLSGLVLLVLVGVAADAAICATFSAVAGRYLARVIWLLPLCALALAAARTDAGMTRLRWSGRSAG